MAIVGIGAELRGDDAAGLRVIALLEDALSKRPPRIPCRTFIGGTAPENVTGAVRTFNPSHILFIDAADLGCEPGAFSEIDPEQTGGASFSTHTLPIGVIVQYLVATTEAEALLVGIQPRSLAYATEMDVGVEEGCRALVEGICEALA